jgi:ABC-type multidrug transport system fused ATPase/permease subunit
MGVMVGSMSLGQAFPTLEVIGSARGAAEKVFEIIEQKSSIDFLSKEGRKLEKVEGNIRFTNLHFTYPARPDVKVCIGKLDIFPLMCAADQVWITELTLIHKNIRSVCNSHAQELTLILIIIG